MKADADMPRLTRRFLLGLASAVAVVPGFAHAGVQSLYGNGRPALPGMGPSRRTSVHFASNEPAGTIVIDTKKKELYLVKGQGVALRYDISVGRKGFGWSGRVVVGAKREWPAWNPPSEMRARQPSLPNSVPPGPYNPLGARALYLFQNGRDTLYRIHGTNDPNGVGFDGTSGCFRLTNTDIVDLFNRVKIGAEVVVK